MATYYVDNILGKCENDGLTPDSPLPSYRALALLPGDKVLFKRGSVWRDKLEVTEGAVGAPITYGAYGEGEKPTFMVSHDLSSPEVWEQIRDNVWACNLMLPGRVGNLIFGMDDNSATFRWEEDQLSCQGDFIDPVDDKRGEGQRLLMYSVSNPATYYSHIEAAGAECWCVCPLKSHVVIEDVCMMNCGIHGAQGVKTVDVTIRRCTFKNIGGCSWSRPLKIRFGNAIEFWTISEDILIEDNEVRNVYDSCVTHQGPGDGTSPTVNFICRNNLFDTYGMAAFEYRDKMPINSTFEGNRCIGAGTGFAMAGEVLPRKSEIWPDPMGHHIFLWRIPKATEGGSLLIRNNYFGSAPVGAAIYSIISPEAEAQMTLDFNIYKKGGIALNRFGGENFTDFGAFKEKCGIEANGKED